jgi:NAD-dependent deacetylase
MQKIVILTGAGISAESGLGTFRDAGGLWAEHRIEDVATPEGFARDPGLVHRFYNARRAQAAEVHPNAAHDALARLQAGHPGEVVIVTQNVDALHEAAGARDVIHMHGELARALCAACEARWPAPIEMSPDATCPACAARACRPDVVWFGEIPYHMDEIAAHLDGADIFAAIGTSGQVYPAAGFAQAAADAGAHCVEINLEPSAVARDFAEARQGRASDVVPAWVDEILHG